MTTTVDHQFDFLVLADSSPMSMFLLRPVSDSAQEWVDEYIGGEVTYWNDAIVIEPRYFDDLFDGITDDDLTVGMESDTGDVGELTRRQ